MIKHWEIKEHSWRKRLKYLLYIDGSESDVVLLLTKLANFCSRPEKAQKPYTFFLPILESEPKTLEKIEKITAELVEQSAVLPEEKEKRAGFIGRLQKPAEVPKPVEEKPEEWKTEEPEIKYSVETESSQEPSLPEEEEEETPASTILERQLEITPNEKDLQESEILRDIDKFAKRESSVSSELTKYLDSEMQKIQSGKPTAEKTEKQPHIMEEIPLDALKIPPPEESKKEETQISAETEIGKPDVPSAEISGRKVSVANIELDIPEIDRIPYGEIEPDVTAEIQPKAEIPIKKEKKFYELTPDNNCTFDNLKPASNRFAHAAVMSAMDSLGAMYNPLVLTGLSGTGKTHFLHAMSFELASRLGEEKIFATDAVKLMTAITQLSKTGNISELDDKITSAEVLLIDDFHLLDITRENKPYFSKWFNGFIDNQKQLVLMSEVPVKELSHIENKLDFWISQGWVVELKYPDEGNYNDIVKHIAASGNVNIESMLYGKYFPAGKYNLTYVKKLCRRVKTLEILTSSKKLSHAELLDIITGSRDKLVSGQFAEDELKKVKKFPGFETSPWGNWAFFAPSGEIAHINMVITGIAEKMKEFDISGGFKTAFEKEYAADDLKNAVMEIFQICQNQNIESVLVICPPSVMHEETIHRKFCSDLEHMFGSTGICISCVDIDKLRLLSSIFQIISDLAGCR